MNSAARRLLVSAVTKRQHQQRLFLSVQQQKFHTTPVKNGGAAPAHLDDHHHDHDTHHHEHYTDDEGRLFNIPKGQSYQNEGWEFGHYLLFGGSLLALLLCLTFKPDYSVDTWADDEFLRRKRAREQREQQN